MSHTEASNVPQREKRKRRLARICALLECMHMEAEAVALRGQHMKHFLPPRAQESGVTLLSPFARHFFSLQEVACLMGMGIAMEHDTEEGLSSYTLISRCGEHRKSFYIPVPDEDEPIKFQDSYAISLAALEKLMDSMIAVLIEEDNLGVDAGDLLDALYSLGGTGTVEKKALSYTIRLQALRLSVAVMGL